MNHEPDRDKGRVSNLKMSENVNAWSDMTFYLQTSFKVTEHPLISGTLCVNYEPDWTKRREYMILTWIFFRQFFYDLNLDETWFTVNAHPLTTCRHSVSEV